MVSGNRLPPTYLSDHLLTVYYYIHGKWLSPLPLTLLCIALSVSIHGKWLSPLPLTLLCIAYQCLFMVSGYLLLL